jgi:hypothetical protein
MIEALIDILKGAITLPVQTKHGMAQIIDGSPHVHVGMGQWKPIAVDSDGAWSYFRMIGNGQVVSADIGQACAGVGISMTLRFVALLERVECEEIPAALVGMAGSIRGTSKTARNTIGAVKVDYTSIRFGIDDVTQQEFTKDPKIPLHKVLVNMDIAVVVEGSAECLELCEYVPTASGDCPEICTFDRVININGVEIYSGSGFDPCVPNTFNLSMI